MLARQLVALRRRKHAVLLGLLIVALAIETFHAQSGAERLRWDALRTVLGIAIWIVIFERPRERAAMAAILLASLAIDWGQYLVQSAAISLPMVLKPSGWNFADSREPTLL